MKCQEKNCLKFNTEAYFEVKLILKDTVMCLVIIAYKAYNIFNSESLRIGTDMEMLNKIRTRLEQEGIPYKYKTKNHLSQTMFPAEGTLRSRMGSLGNDVDQMIEYEILVHKKDYEKSTNLLD